MYYQTTVCHIQADGYLHGHCCKKLKPQTCQCWLRSSDWTAAHVKLQQTVSYIPAHIRQMFAYSEHSPVVGHNLNRVSLPRVSALEDYSASGWTSSYHDKTVEYSVVAEFGSGTQWIQFHGRMFTDLKIPAPEPFETTQHFYATSKNLWHQNNASVSAS